MPGASDQYALHIRQPMDAPTAIDATGVSWPGHYFFLGRHFRVGSSLNTVLLNQTVPISTPNETLVVEIYPRAFGNETITHAPGQPLASTPVCTDLAVRGCDEYDPIADEIRPGPDQVLDTVRIAPDLGVELMSRCAGGIEFYIDATHAPMRKATLAHEGAHGLQVDHAEYYMNPSSACGTTVMYSVGTALPIPTQFIELDKQQIRTHAKHP